MKQSTQTIAVKHGNSLIVKTLSFYIIMLHISFVYSSKTLPDHGRNG